MNERNQFFWGNLILNKKAKTRGVETDVICEKASIYKNNLLMKLLSGCFVVLRNLFVGYSIVFMSYKIILIAYILNLWKLNGLISAVCLLLSFIVS